MMMFEDINRKLWQAYERSGKLYLEHPLIYRLKLVFLLFQAFLMLLIIIAVIVWLVLLNIKSPLSQSAVKMWIFLAFNGVISIIGYIMFMRSRPWRNMLHLRKCDYPVLYREINYIAHILKAPKIHRIYISTDFNAAVDSEYTFIPGLRRNILILGYPLLCGFSSKALLGCLAHEFGHLAANHLSWKGIFWRIAAFWSTFQLGIFTWVYHFWRVRFLKSLNVTLHPVYYRHEIEADRNIIEKFGAGYAAECLLQIELKSRIYAEDKTVFFRIATEKMEDIDFAAEFRTVMQKPLTREYCRLQIEKALKSVPPVFDEHHSFRDRLAMTGITDYEKHALAEPNAFTKLIEDKARFNAAFNVYFRGLEKSINLDEIREEYAKNTELLKKFNPSAEYSPDEYRDFLSALKMFSRDSECAAVLEHACNRFPESPDLRCLKLSDCLERTENEQEQSAIVGQLEKIISASPVLIILVNDILLKYYLEHGETERLKSFFDLRDIAMGKVKGRFAADLAKDDMLSAVHPGEAEMTRIAEAVSKKKGIHCVYAVSRHYDNLIVYTNFMVIRPERVSFSLSDPHVVAETLQELFPDYQVVVGKEKYCVNVLDSIPGARVWDVDVKKNHEQDNIKRTVVQPL